jgi:ribonuclease HI
MSPPRPPDPRFLTLFVDASFCHRTHAAGYGAWAKKATFAKGLIFGGPLPRGITNAGEAELGGIALALRFLLEQQHLAGLDRLMVQSDSLRSLQLISRVLPGVRIANHADAAAVTKAQVAPSGRMAPTAPNVRVRMSRATQESPRRLLHACNEGTVDVDPAPTGEYQLSRLLN